MDPRLRIVVRIPLDALWNDQGPLDFKRESILSSTEVESLARTAGVPMVVADCGEKLRWIPKAEALLFWKTKLQGRIVEPLTRLKGFRLEDYPGEYCFVSSLWTDGAQERIVLLEKYH